MKIPESLTRKADDIIRRFPADHRQAALVPLMFETQRELGFISPETERWLAETVGVSAVKVREVLTFYSMFHTGPVGKYVIQLCHNISCCLCRRGEFAGASGEETRHQERRHHDRRPLHAALRRVSRRLRVGADDARQ